METIRSLDGTQIAYQRLGEGPPLVLVHGLGAANPVVWPATPLLAEHFTIIAPDRRGRRASGDEPSYALEREFEDIAVLADSFGEPVSLLGHSWGGLLALEAARLTSNLQRLILYEPAIHPPEGVTAAFVVELQALLEAGEHEQVMITLFSIGDALDPDELQNLRSSPSWADRVASAPTVPREVRAGLHYRFVPQRFQDMLTPTLLLIGEKSPGFYQRDVELVHAALPDSQLTVLPEQHHLAMYTAPELFLEKVLAFLTEAE
jgi:pimeloyl-ACP methyl ester carboxylesterase